LIDPTITNQTELKGFGLFTGQLGVAINNVLIYGKGGAAVTADRYAAFATAGGALLGSVSQSRWGGTAGLGIEYGFTPNWTAAFEYDRLFMGGRNFSLLGPAGILFTNERITRDVDVLTVRVNYRFGGPIIAQF
jgi:outer membrane immunogenic protein